MVKKVLLFSVIVVILVIAYYLIAPAFVVIESDEPAPQITSSPSVEQTQPTVPEPNIPDMDLQIKEMFMKEMQKTQDKVMEMNEPSPKAASTDPTDPTSIVGPVSFQPKAHDVKGSAQVIQGPEQTTLRFEDFETINGPNLHIYLATDTSAKDHIDLGKIKATKGNVNYEIPPGTDTERYNHVLVWCVPFKVLFSYAQLS